MSGDRRAREELVEYFLPAVANIARGYGGSRAIDREALVQAGVVGLLRALRRYDPERGTPFWAYASWWVRQAMQQVVAEPASPVALSDRALLALVRRAEHSRAGAASTAALARECGLAREQIDALLVAGPGADDAAFEPGRLGAREREVLTAHFGVGRPSRTLDEIAATLGVSGECVCQIEARALEKLRRAALYAAS